MKKLNLHLHTNYSDGHTKMYEYAMAMKKMNYACLVTSDHDYDMDLINYENQCWEANELSKLLNFPVICGLEISLWEEEAILINQEVCKEWLKVRDELKKAVRDRNMLLLHSFFNSMKRKHGKYALILVHSSKVNVDQDFNTMLFYALFTAYEVANHGCYGWQEKHLDKLKALMPVAKQVAGIDAHGLSTMSDWLLGNTFMWIKNRPKRFLDEIHLIDIINNGKFKINPKGLKYNLVILKYYLKHLIDNYKKSIYQ